jgi:phosphoribosylformylglycinamidine synthase
VQRLSGADRSRPAARRADAQCGHPLRLPRSEADGENNTSAFTQRYFKGQTITIPVAHHDGNFFADDATLDRLEGEGRVAFRYAEEVNGSARNIAGVLNEGGNVLGMMPHPERFIEAAQGGIDGRALFEGVTKALLSA